MNLPEFDGEWHCVDEHVDLKDAQEEEAEMFKHFREEIPEDANVWCQIRYRQAETPSVMLTTLKCTSIRFVSLCL